MKPFKQLYDLKSFLVLWSTQGLSELGSAMTSYAMIIWAYQQTGKATSITLLSVCSFLPSILFCFAAGTLADRWNKKAVMLISDAVAALGTISILALYTTSSLQIWHLYLINAIIGLMNAFQNPASYVAVSLLAPKELYHKVSALQSLSSSLVTILQPAIATAVLSLAGIRAVLLIDLFTFGFAFCSLLFFIKIPKIPAVQETKERFWESCKQGLSFLRGHRPIWRIILFFSFVNLLASMAGNAILPAMILARTNQNSRVLGMVTTAIGLGTLVGSLLATFSKPAKSRVRVIFLSCAVSFVLCDLLWGGSQNALVWIFAAFAGNLPLPFLNANLTAIMRTKVPIEMQGRVFSARDTVQYITIPLGLALGGLLADYLFEPLMLHPSAVQQALSLVVGTGKGSGMAVIFLVTGAVGCIASLLAYRNPLYRELDD